ncbi:MAG: type III toxin-antitoxin system ToxN/AbiQ family toxin [Clostridia bacterium]|nr:type III toxin-antitoxin system ToxN/AbiQ family toxin [Clostridia bacterium]
MFRLNDNLKLIHIDPNYVKALHDACSEVFYSSKHYDNKPYLGILVSNDNNQKYVIPLTSAKEKHKTWKNIDFDRYLIYETSNLLDMGHRDIYTISADDPQKVKHILSAIEIKKMIPIRDDVYSIVDINANDSDSTEEKKYKDLLNKEYSFCIKIIDQLVEKASKIYDKQITTGKISNFACDFKALEAVCATYKK